MNETAKAGLLKAFADLVSRTLGTGLTGRFGVMVDVKQGGIVNVETTSIARIDPKDFGSAKS